MKLFSALHKDDKNILVFLRRNLTFLSLLFLIVLSFEVALFFLGFGSSIVLIIIGLLGGICIWFLMFAGAIFFGYPRATSIFLYHKSQGVILNSCDWIFLSLVVSIAGTITGISIGTEGKDWYLIKLNGVAKVDTEFNYDLQLKGATAFSFTAHRLNTSMLYGDIIACGIHNCLVCMAPVVSLNSSNNKPVYFWAVCGQKVKHKEMNCYDYLHESSCMDRWLLNSFEGIQNTYWDVKYIIEHIPNEYIDRDKYMVLTWQEISSIYSHSYHFFISVVLIWNCAFLVLVIARWPWLWKSWNPN
eukprot:TRINITY_DN13007_c0_g1_i1.p1 TRINITY_DN13007_c0_g1~~TRINITY_DN13007_c0_g1_i1.p1  ORF type:complete len:301 (-),score=20.33 TRINITY_DN13007_c0_g1_i1:256-1158(-)